MPSSKIEEQAKLLRQSDAFNLTVATRVEDVPIILKNAARNYRINAKPSQARFLEVHRLKSTHPQLWTEISDIMEEASKIIEERIVEYKAKYPKGKRSRERLCL